MSRRAGQRDRASRLSAVFCVVVAHAALIAALPALGPRVAVPSERIAVRLLDPDPPPASLPEPERPAVPLPVAPIEPPRPSARASRRLEAPVARPFAPDPMPDPARGATDDTTTEEAGTSASAAPVVPAGTLAAAASVANGPVAAPPAPEPAGPSADRSIGGSAATLVPARHDADYLRNPAPAYPAISRRMRETGTVLLRVDVGEDGAPRAVGIELGSGHARLDEAARSAVAGWRFVPARRGDAAVASRVLVPIVFRLDD